MHPAATFLAPDAAGRHLRPPFHRLLHSPSSLPSHPEVDCSVRRLCDCFPAVTSPPPWNEPRHPFIIIATHLTGQPFRGDQVGAFHWCRNTSLAVAPRSAAAGDLLWPPARHARARSSRPHLLPPEVAPGSLPGAFILPARVTTVAGSVFRLIAGIAAPPALFSARQVWSRHSLPLCRDRRHLPPLPNVTSRRVLLLDGSRRSLSKSVHVLDFSSNPHHSCRA